MTLKAHPTQAWTGFQVTQPGVLSPGCPATVSSESPPRLSIVVPTRNEAGNIEHLVRRLAQALAPMRLEIIFVDDSDDNTPAVVEAVARVYGNEKWALRQF